MRILTMKEAKLSLKTHERHKTIVELARGVSCGARELFIVAGPCSVENSLQLEQIAATLCQCGLNALRGGIYKPRTSPYQFQGLKEAGLEILASAGAKYALPVITEVLSAEQLQIVERRIQAIQIGSRNMQNFELLRAAGRAGKPVILKRGMAATVEELLLAAEYIMLEGNSKVILCERGIRSFDPLTRNVLDLGAAVALKQLTHLPVIVDPSHAAGRREFVADLSRAAIAAGVDGLMIECHPQPEQSLSDARQAMSLDSMLALLGSLVPVAAAVGRQMQQGIPVSQPSSAANVASRTVQF
jgi:3-deoxy-7-phosphoheptulonate synthase